MKQYVVDELRYPDYEKLKTYLEDTFEAAATDNIFWIPLASEFMTPAQAEHKDCQPFYFAFELESESLACELLVRTHNHVTCSCMGYATENQRNWLIRIVDSIFEQLEIKH